MTLSPIALPGTIPSVLINNWERLVSISRSFETDITRSAETRVETRRAFWSKPLLTLKVRFTGLNKEDANRLNMNLHRLSHQINPFPLYSDLSKITATSSDTSIFADFSNRRFFIDGRIVIFTVGADGPTSVEYGTILDTISSSEISLDEALSGTFDPASGVHIVMPIIDCKLNLSGKMKVLTDQKNDVEIEVQQIQGLSALPPTATDIPGIYTEFTSIPIFFIRPNWTGEVDIEIIRPGREEKSGRSTIVTEKGDRPVHAFSFSMMFDNRSDAWDLIELYDYCRGRWQPIWIINPHTLWTLVAITASYIDIVAVDNANDVSEFYRQVAIIENDGTITIGVIDKVADNDTTLRITFTSSIASINLADVERVTSAHLSRFSEDSQEEIWMNDGVCVVQMKTIELYQEKTITIDNISDPVVFADPEEIEDLYVWFDSNKNVWGGESEGDQDFLLVATPQLASTDNPTLWNEVTDPYSAIFLSPDWTQHKPGLNRNLNHALNHTLPYMQMFDIPDYDRFHLHAPNNQPFWDNTEGLTMFFVYSMDTEAVPDPETTYYFFNREDVFSFERDKVKMYEDVGSGVQEVNFSIDILAQGGGEALIMAFVWKPGEYARAYLHGVLIGSDESPINDLPEDDPETPDVVGRLQLARIYSMMIYKRALTIEEINQIGEWMTERWRMRPYNDESQGFPSE